MFPSLETNGCEDLFNPHPRTMLPTFTTHLESPSSQPFPFSPDESCLINQFLLQQQDAKASLVCKNKDKCVDGTNSSKEVPRRRMGKKKDRHSKICTAQGPRDRRMRLSLTIARKFFDLQDMLGFDKASKTIEWLISKSKTSIKQVKESVAAASGSGGEGDSTRLLVDEKVKSETSKVPKRRTQTMESSCMKRESREKARERARERTATKMKMRLSSGLIDTSKTISDPNQETSEIKLTTNGAQLVEGESQEWRDANVNIIEKFLGLTSDSSSSSVFRDSEEPNTIGMVTPREHNTTSVNEENPISFSLYDYLCY